MDNDPKKEDAEEFLTRLENDAALQKSLNVEQSMVDLGKQIKLYFTVDQLDQAIEDRCKSTGSGFLARLGFSEVPGF